MLWGFGFCMKNSISKPVVALAAAGITLIALVVWFGLLPRENKSELTNSSAAAEQSAANPASPPPAGAVSPAAETTDSLAPVIPISLTNVIDEAEKKLAQSDLAVRELPHGTQVYGGIEFWLQGLIHLQGLATRDEEHDDFRTRIIVPLAETNFVGGAAQVTQRGSNIATLYLLGGARYSSRQAGEKFADIIWHYTDGLMAHSEIQYDVQLRDWWRTPYEDPAQLPNALTRVAWNGPHPPPKDHSLRLYRVAFLNPHPEQVVDAIEFASAMARPALFVMALTLDPLKPGARPDDLTSAEMTDPELNGQLQLIVQDTEGHPLAAARVTASSRNTAAGQISPRFTTDNNGLALVRYPDSGLETLDVGASHDDYGTRKMVWDLKAGDSVPATYTLKLTAGVSIGGTVVDENSSPIAEAKIALNRFWSGGEEINQKGEQDDFPSQNLTTDAQGSWQAKGLPAGLLDHIFLDVKHPDFMGTNITVGANGTMESQLRAGALKIILRRGLDVRGLVMDENYNPLSDATVWAGKKYYRDRQETKTDAQGKFSFRNISEGSVAFSVDAKGRQPDSKLFTVKAGMPDIVFRLPPGHVIRGVVQDEIGSPLSGVRVVLEGEGDIGRTYEFSATTGADGRFTWDGAPAGPMQFYFGKEGFADSRNKSLTPDKDNVVVLHKPRQIHGQVLDENTGNPLAKFRVGVGRTSNNNDTESFYADWPGLKDKTDANGQFTLEVREEASSAIRAEADDHLGQTQILPEAQGTQAQITFRLKPSADLHGIVTAPDGTPLSGVSVAITRDGPGGSVSLQGSHFTSWSSGSKISITDPQGRFTLGSLPETGGTVVAVGDLGFASASVDQVHANPNLVLQMFGRIEGTLKIGGQPGAGKELYFTMDSSGINTDFNSYKTTTDDQGKFSFEKIPPGEGGIVRLITTSPNSWAHSDRTSVTVQPAQTTHITLGDAGAILKGTVRLETPPADGEALNFEGHLFSQMPVMPPFNSAAEAQAFYSSPEWKELNRLRKTYALAVNPDGSFTVDNVVPGTYSLNISARKGGDQPWSNPPIAQGHTTVTVPDNANPFSPINVGEIVLKPTAPTQPAPTQ
jgi:uncharacterized GH25 family protein